MKKKIVSYYLFSFIISLLSLFYIKYYEQVLYNQTIRYPNIFLDILYSYIAMPVLYFFIASVVTIFIIYLFKIEIPEKVRKVLKCIFILFLIIYFIFLLLMILRCIGVALITFDSIYLIIFSIFGIIFSLTMKLKS